MPSSDDEPGRDDGEYIGGVGSEELLDADDTLSPTPTQHERLKNHLHGEQFREIKRADRRYLVVGRGGDDAPGKRRRRVRDILDDRPEATAFRLEDFGLSGDELELWVPAFDILSETATHIVGILEDYDGGHVWELGYLYHHQRHIRDVLWLLKRIYGTEATQREKYDNGMAASHLAALEEATGDRVIPWGDPDDLSDAVEKIP
ncbi:aminopeptidase [Halorussus salilacus]|uniref:aminopeptidase n=1 Tax=Halorussus salilacus TaxID=2953750 RepID=UPI0020A015B7|nr:aminopeptidase [Halorussus salilacus]USZ68333.1 aminopeptidase [Halorussus salilacus]